MKLLFCSNDSLKPNKSMHRQCHLLTKKDKVVIRIVDTCVKNSLFKKLLDIRPNSRINFNGHDKMKKSQPQS